MDDRKISGAARGEKGALQHNPEELELSDHGPPLRDERCQCATPDMPPAHHRMRGTGVCVSAAASALARTSPTATTVASRPSRHAECSRGRNMLYASSIPNPTVAGTMPAIAARTRDRKSVV